MQELSDLDQYTFFAILILHINLHYKIYRRQQSSAPKLPWLAEASFPWYSADERKRDFFSSHMMKSDEK